MLITPSGKDKASLEADDIAMVDIATGENLTPGKKLSIETEMHRLIYISRSDALSVVHTHPVFSCLFSALDIDINTAIIAENWYLLDKVVKVPYARMGSKELASSVASFAKDSNAMLLENHGAVAIGRSLLEAFDRLESLEQAAKMTIFGQRLGVHSLGEEERTELSQMR